MKDFGTRAKQQLEVEELAIQREEEDVPEFTIGAWISIGYWDPSCSKYEHTNRQGQYW